MGGMKNNETGDYPPGYLHVSGSCVSVTIFCRELFFNLNRSGSFWENKSAFRPTIN